MVSEVQIANRALSMLGEARITSIDDANKPARAMKARFDILRDVELSAYPWRFAVKRVQLASLTEVPAWGYTKIYARPVGDLRPIRVGGAIVNSQTIGINFQSTGITGEETPYEIIDGKIHTDLSAPLDYEYISQVTDTGSFDPLFAEALAARLAADAAEELTQSKAKKEAALFTYDRTIKNARQVNSLYRPPRRRQAGRWMTARINF